MSILNTREKYGFVSKLFHWLIGLMIIGMLAVGLWMVGLPLGPLKLEIYGYHKSTGMILLVLILLRFLWRMVNIAPPLPPHVRFHERLLAHSTHFLLYLLMFIMPISGWLMSSAAGFPVVIFGMIQVPDLIAPNKELLAILKLIHEFGAYAFILLIGLHSFGALYHHYFYKDTILKRMLPWGK